MPSAEMVRRFDDRTLVRFDVGGKVGESARYFAEYEAAQISIKIICKEADAADAHATALLRAYAKQRHDVYDRDFGGFSRASKAYAHAKCEAEDLGLLYQIELTRAHFIKVEAQRLANEETLVVPKGAPRVSHGVAAEIMALPDDAPAVGVLVYVQDATEPIEYTVFTAKECFHLDVVDGFTRRIEPNASKFAGRVLRTFLQFAHFAQTGSDGNGKNWGLMKSLGIRGGSVARVMAHLASDTFDRGRWEGYGKYKLNMEQLGSLRDLLRIGPPIFHNRSQEVSNDWYQCDQGEFFGALEAVRPKEDGPFGMVRLTRYLCKCLEWEDGLKQALLGYAQEHVEELREPPPLRKKKPATEPLVVVTRVLNKVQASIYPTLLGSPPPTPRPMSPIHGADDTSDSEA